MVFNRILILGLSMLFSACVASSSGSHGGDMKPLTPKENEKRTEIELENTVKEIMSMSLVQDEFEKNDEYIKRVKSLFLQYDGRRYEVTNKCNEVYGRWERKKLVDYDVENESLILTLPDLDRELMRVDNQGTFRELYSSFIAVGEPEQILSKYRASNAFGKEIEVVKLREKSTGVAIMTEGIKFYKTIADSWSVESYMKSQPKPKQFRIPMQREKARNVINDCRVVFDVESVFIDMYPYQMREILGTEKQPMRSILLTKLVDYVKPKIAKQYDVERWNYKIPVVLLGVKIISSEGEEFVIGKFF